MAKAKEQTGCRLCKYRVAPRKGPNGEAVPSCCFNLEIDDTKPMNHCEMFTDGDYYVKHPNEP